MAENFDLLNVMEDDQRYQTLYIHDYAVPSEHRSRLVYEIVPELLRVQILTNKGLRWFIKCDSFQIAPQLWRKMMMKARIKEVEQEIEWEISRIQTILRQNQLLQQQENSTVRREISVSRNLDSPSEASVELATEDFVNTRL